jgi:signal transduction histidine kinase
MAQDNLTKDFCRIVARGVHSSTLPEEILSLIRKHLQLREAVLYLQGSNEDYVQNPIPKGNASTVSPDRILLSDPFVNFLKYSKQTLYRKSSVPEQADPIQEKIQEQMSQRKVEASIPLMVGEELVGFLNLGPREDGAPPLPERVNGLSELYDQIALILQNRILCENLRRSQAKMRRKDRLALLGTLTAGLAHEIRNPLVSIKTYFQLLPERYQDQEFRERFHKVAVDEVDRISRLVEELLQFARPPVPKLRSVNIHQLIDEVVTLLETTAEWNGIRLKRSFDQEQSSEVICDPEQIKQILLNIAHNALEAVDEQGEVTIRIRHEKDRGTSGFVHIEIEDNGIGMNAEEIEKLFVPFYTTKRSGTGLGLAISRQIVEEHLGNISVESRPGQGTTFFVHLPKDPSLHERRKEKSDVEQVEQNDAVQ